MNNTTGIDEISLNFSNESIKNATTEQNITDYYGYSNTFVYHYSYLFALFTILFLMMVSYVSVIVYKKYKTNIRALFA